MWGLRIAPIPPVFVWEQTVVGPWNVRVCYISRNVVAKLVSVRWFLAVCHFCHIPCPKKRCH